MNGRFVIGLLALCAAVLPDAGLAQRRRGGNAPDGYLPNAPYDGRFTFVRVRFTPATGADFGFRRDVKWDHDYPRAERHFTKILDELTTIRPRVDESNILTLDDPELNRFPIAYLCEPGFWAPTPAEALGLRNYLLKGGFLIVDDFAERQWYNFEAQMRKVLPEAKLIPLTPEHAVFDSFYRIESLDYSHPYYGFPSRFLGVFEDNDPAKRLMMIVNYNNDIAEYWEFSDTGYFPIDLSNDAYKLGVNYLVYAFTR